MKVKYELDQRRTSGIQLNTPEGKFTFSARLADRKIVRELEEDPRLEQAVKGGLLIKHISEGKVLTKDGELSYSEYKKQLKKIGKKAPKVEKAKKAKKEVKKEAKKEVKKEAEDKAKKEAEDKAKKDNAKASKKSKK